MTNPYERPARPWDLINPNLVHVPSEIAEERMSICNGCENFKQLTKTCNQCGCIMPLKTKLPNAACPVGKWGMLQPTPAE